MKNGFSLVIFDCDGVLVDSEVLTSRVLAETVKDFGLILSVQEAISLFRGCKMADCIATITERIGKALPDDFETKLRARMADVFRSELQPVAGIHDALARIKIPFCVASSGPREKIALTLSIAGLLPLFEGSVFSSYEVGSWKPSPGLFLHAAATLGATPSECAVVEDSALGVRAGVSAGMTVFAYVPPHDDATHLEALGGIVFRHMSELPVLLQRV